MTSSKKTPAEDGPTRPFASFLQEIQHGRTHDELSDALRDLITAVKETGKGGTLTLKLDVKPMKGDPDVLVITDTVTAKEPSHDRKTSIFYADKNGNLSKENPNQLSFDGIKAVEDQPAKDISAKEEGTA